MKKRIDRKQLLNLLWILFICAACFGIGWMANTKINSDGRLIQDARKLIINESFYNNLSDNEMSYAAIRGLLSAIDDPYAELIEPEASQDLINTFAGDTGVVGLYAENQDGQIVIIHVFPGSSAQEKGVEVGDRLISIDGVIIDSDADSSEIGLLLRGVPGTEVNLEIMRSDQVREFSLVRREQEFLTYRMLPENIGYISLLAFNENASQKMKTTLEELLRQDPIGLIWDLRNNEGGDMFATQEILSYLIDDGLLFSAELSRQRNVEFFADGDAFAKDIPLVVLIDETTYSAGETAAAAVSELGRGKTIGSSTYGKGIIQATMPIRDDVLLQMTIAKWLSAHGEWYHERGVPAEIEVFDDTSTRIDEVLEKGVDMLMPSD